MDRLRKKYEQINQALTTFDDAIHLFYTIEKNEQLTDKKNMHSIYKDIGYDQLLLALRDSIIQRFEYTIDGLWKYLKDYLELIAGIMPPSSSPKNIIRTATSIGIISEQESEQIIEMLDYRNNTSHRYQEDLAEIIKNGSRRYCDLLKTVIARLAPHQT